MQNDLANSQPSEPIASERIENESKRFFIDLKENSRGRVFKITEDNRGRRNTLMLPAEGGPEFLEALRRLIEFESKL